MSLRFSVVLGAATTCAISASCAGPSPVGHSTVAAAIREEPSVPTLVPLGPTPVSMPARRCDDKTDTVRFTVAHLNDMQARYGELIAGRSRYAYVAGYLRKLKEDVPDTIVLDAGDDYEKGSVAELHSMGETTRQMIQALPIDVRTIGNHDFAYGESAVLRDLTLSTHPVLAANISRKDGGATPFKSFVRIDVACMKIGVVGLVTSNYGANDLPSREPFDGVFVHDDKYADILSREVKEHRGEVDVMIALDHLGYWTDVELAAKVPGVDLVVGGHSEDLVKDPRAVVRADGSRVFILQAGHYAQDVGRADLTFSRWEHKLSLDHYKMVAVDASLPYVDEVADLERKLEHESAPDARVPIAVAKSEVRVGKAMADLTFRAVCDRWGADALLLGKDVFWDGLPAGAVSLQRLYDTVLVQREPAGTSGFSSLSIVEVTGKEPVALRERSRFGAALFAFYTPDAIVPARTYRLAIEKRALTFPAYAFGLPAMPLPQGRYAGELIDVLDAYARARTARGLTID